MREVALILVPTIGLIRGNAAHGDVSVPASAGSYLVEGDIAGDGLSVIPEVSAAGVIRWSGHMGQVG